MTLQQNAEQEICMYPINAIIYFLKTALGPRSSGLFIGD
jgi:hypothetical protein